jgi:phosphotransacetylase
MAAKRSVGAIFQYFMKKVKVTSESASVEEIVLIDMTDLSNSLRD